MSRTGTLIDTRRSSVPRFSTFAAMFPELSPNFPQLRLVRREGLEPSCLAASDPKSGASANSATFAGCHLLRIINVLYARPSFPFFGDVPVDHYENFPVASFLLPAPLRRPVEIIYRFARSADDFADEGSAPPG